LSKTTNLYFCNRMSRRFTTSVGLMTAAIIVIAAFQIYWLNVKIEEEKKTLRFRTNVLFRESVFDLQSSKLKIDSSAKCRVGFPPDIARFADIVRKRLSDSLLPAPPGNRNSIITLERPIDRFPMNDSASGPKYRWGGRFFEFLKGIDSLQDSLKMSDIYSTY